MVKASGVTKQAVAVVAILSTAMVNPGVNQALTDTFHATLLDKLLNHSTWENQGIAVESGLQEMRLENSITVFGDQSMVSQLSTVIKEYPSLWEDHGKTVDVPELQYLTILLKDNWMQDM